MDLNIDNTSTNEQSSQSTIVKGDVVINKAFDEIYCVPNGIAAIPVLVVMCIYYDTMSCFDTHSNKIVEVPKNQFRKLSHISL